MDAPPENDVCSICHQNFHIPCQANCSHWFCGALLTSLLSGFVCVCVEFKVLCRIVRLLIIILAVTLSSFEPSIIALTACFNVFVAELTRVLRLLEMGDD